MKQKLQIALALAVVVTAIRTGYILYERHEDYKAAAKPQPARTAGYANADYYVVPRRLHAYDLKSAKQLTQQPVWVKEGYSYTYYPYDAGHHVNFSHEAGLLLPIEKLQIKDVIVAASPKSPGQKQVMAAFEKDGKTYAFSIGVEQGSNYQIYSDEMLYIQDPHELYKHWPADIWGSIDKHEAKLGMSELQADFAIGLGFPESEGNPKTVNYANGGKPLSIVYQDGKAVAIKPDKASS